MKEKSDIQPESPALNVEPDVKARVVLTTSTQDGAAVAIAGAAGAGGVVVVESNPVYQGPSTAGHNPLAKG